jgi:hypothetical protein
MVPLAKESFLPVLGREKGMRVLRCGSPPASLIFRCPKNNKELGFSFGFSFLGNPFRKVLLKIGLGLTITKKMLKNIPYRFKQSYMQKDLNRISYK